MVVQGELSPQTGPKNTAPGGALEEGHFWGNLGRLVLARNSAECNKLSTDLREIQEIDCL